MHNAATPTARAQQRPSRLAAGPSATVCALATHRSNCRRRTRSPSCAHRRVTLRNRRSWLFGACAHTSRMIRACARLVRPDMWSRAPSNASLEGEGCHPSSAFSAQLHIYRLQLVDALDAAATGGSPAVPSVVGTTVAAPPHCRRQRHDIVDASILLMSIHRYHAHRLDQVGEHAPGGLRHAPRPRLRCPRLVQHAHPYWTERKRQSREDHARLATMRCLSLGITADGLPCPHC
jgi:hypothetical protein